MSEMLFARSGRTTRSNRARLLATGAAAALAIVLAAGYLGASYLGIITSNLTARAELTTVGDSLGIGADVKFRGLIVGRVLSVEPGSHPSARIELLRGEAGEIPADVHARVLPGTLFGNEYVDLVSTGGAGELADGALIPADRSAETLRLVDTIGATQRLLVAVDPAHLDVAIAELADALEGRGPVLGRFIEDTDAVLQAWARDEPAFYRDLDLVARNVETFGDIEPQLASALRDSLPLARTIADKQVQTERIIAQGRVLVTSLTGFLGDVVDQVFRILRGTAATLDVFAWGQRAFEQLMAKLPAVMENGATAIDGVRVQMNAGMAGAFPDAYGPQDCPRYGSKIGRGCPGSTGTAP